MSKPDWCTQDVWERAVKLGAPFDGEQSEKSIILTIARAILSAEKRGEDREREANKQNEDAILRADTRSNNWMQAIAVRAAAIRNRTATQETT